MLDEEQPLVLDEEEDEHEPKAVSLIYILRKILQMFLGSFLSPCVILKKIYKKNRIFMGGLVQCLLVICLLGI